MQIIQSQSVFRPPWLRIILLLILNQMLPRLEQPLIHCFLPNSDQSSLRFAALSLLGPRFLL